MQKTLLEVRKTRFTRRICGFILQTCENAAFAAEL